MITLPKPCLSQAPCLTDHKLVPMAVLTLASSSPIRAQLLRGAGLDIDVVPARVDEAALRDSLLAEGASARDIADALAEQKARQVSRRKPGLVVGCDQILECESILLAKPESRDEACEQLRFLRGKTHRLHTASVIYEGGAPIWRHVNVPRLTMRSFSDAWLTEYLDRTWPDVAQCVGAYKIEALGVRLFSSIEGDLFSIQGLPLVELLSFLTVRGDLPS